MAILEALELPIVQAPLAGGPSTPALAAAVSEAGGLGFLAAGYKTANAVRADVGALRALTGRPFGLNLFAPPRGAADAGAVAAFAGTLRGESERAGVSLGDPRRDDDGWEAKLALAEAERVPVVSFTFGSPDAAVVERMHAAGAEVWVTVTGPAEARIARDAGADALVVQGVEAGGHRASFDDDAGADLGILAALQLIGAAVELPWSPPAGSRPGARSRRCSRRARRPRSSARHSCAAPRQAPPARTARRSPPRTSTALTRAFTGRTARGIVNRFLREHSPGAPSAYPEVHHLTAPLRAAARERGDADGFHLWAGQAHTLAVEEPAGALVRRLAAEAAAALEAAGRRVSPPAPG